MDNLFFWFAIIFFWHFSAWFFRFGILFLGIKVGSAATKQIKEKGKGVRDGKSEGSGKVSEV